jgi:hypothetical protein
VAPVSRGKEGEASRLSISSSGGPVLLGRASEFRNSPTSRSGTERLSPEIQRKSIEGRLRNSSKRYRSSKTISKGSGEVSHDCVTLAAEQKRPIVAVLTAHDAEQDSIGLDPIIVALLEAGSGYFMCFGRASESLHDRIDEIVVERGLTQSRQITTTWHEDETGAEAVEFLVNVAGAREGSLMAAILGETDNGLAQLLIKQVSG